MTAGYGRCVAAARQDGSARKEALLDAALKCFGERGLVETGIEDIRKAAGASPSSVYHLFEHGLSQLIAALLERIFERRYSYVTERVLKAKTAKKAVFTLVEAHLDWVMGHATEARFMYQALALDLDGGYRDGVRETKRNLKEALCAHLASLDVIPGDERGQGALDVLLLGVAHQACRSHFIAPDSIDLKWARKELPALTWTLARALPKLPSRSR